MKTRLLFLGDIHGNFALIHQYVTKYDIKDAIIIQVGDFGVGFNFLSKEKRLLEMYHHVLVKNNVTVYAVRGNHDYKGYFDNDPFELSNIKLVPDYTVLNINDKNILCIGGAVSVDRVLRYTKCQKNGDFTTILGNEQWWPDETFVFDEGRLKGFRNIDTVVTHTCPHYCHPDNTNGFGPFVQNMIDETNDLELKTDLMVERNLLTQAFAILKENNKITNHYYGHFHRNHLTEFDDIKHRLLGIGELYEERN